MAGARFFLLLFLLTSLFAGCGDVRPAVKIGLIAPFEGLHRRTGYEALAAMRAAIAETPAGAVGVLPLALDDSGDPVQAQRALAKLLASSDVAAIVGPLSPALAAAVAGGPPAAPLLAPFALPGRELTGGAEPAAWAAPLVQSVGELAAANAARGLVLAGWTPGWPDLTAAEWSALAGLPVRLSNDPASVNDGEAVLWLGAADSGAAYLDDLRAGQPDAQFWLGLAGDDPVFAERTAARTRVYWVVWVDDGYNAWAAAHSPSSPSAYLVYRATQAALRKMADPDDAPPPPPTWRVQAYTFDAAGDPVPYAAAP